MTATDRAHAVLTALRHGRSTVPEIAAHTLFSDEEIVETLLGLADVGAVRETPDGWRSTL